MFILQTPSTYKYTKNLCNMCLEITSVMKLYHSVILIFCKILNFWKEYTTQIRTLLILYFPNTERSQMELCISRSLSKNKNPAAFSFLNFQQGPPPSAQLMPHSEVELDITTDCFFGLISAMEKKSQYAGVYLRYIHFGKARKDLQIFHWKRGSQTF